MKLYDVLRLFAAFSMALLAAETRAFVPSPQAE